MYSIYIPGWHPLRLNQLLGCHHLAAYRRKQKDYEVVGRALLIYRVPKATGRRRVGLVIHLKPHQRGGDPDAYWKVLLDALTHNGALKDDNRQWLELSQPTFVRADIPGTTITLEDL